MTLVKEIKVDLVQHTLERLLERQPHFMNFTVKDSQEVINLLNEKYSSGIIHDIKHKKARSKHDLEIPTLSGVFYLVAYPQLKDVYFASTFKILKIRKWTSTAEYEVSVRYSLSCYDSSEIVNKNWWE